MTPLDFMALCRQGIAYFVLAVERLAEQKAAAAQVENPNLFMQEAATEVLASIDSHIQMRDLLREQKERVEVKTEPVTLSLGMLVGKLNRSRSGFYEQEKALKGFPPYKLYIVRDGDACLYVGYTRQPPRTRLRGHVSRPRSDLGKAIVSNPNSANWTVEIVPVSDQRTALIRERQLQVQLKPKYCTLRH